MLYALSVGYLCVRCQLYLKKKERVYHKLSPFEHDLFTDSANNKIVKENPPMYFCVYFDEPIIISRPMR